MAGFNRNVYETFERIHQLSDTEGPGAGSAMDRAEYQIQVNNLVEGLVELLQHAATHRLISLDIGEYDHELDPGDVGVYRDDSDEPAANHTVAIRVPDEYLAEEDSLAEAIAAFDLPTVETSADLAVAAMARLRLLANTERDLESELYEKWSGVARTLVPRIVPALRRLEAAGLLTVYDARTKRGYAPIGVEADERAATAEVAFVSAEAPVRDGAAARRPQRRPASAGTPKAKAKEKR